MAPSRLILCMCAAEVLSMIGVFAFPALLPQFLAEWGLSNTQAGWINGIYFAGYTLAVPVLGSLTDRVDGRRIFLVFAGVGMLASLGFAFLARGFWTALAFRTLGGLGLAGTFIPGLKALVDRLEGASQARAVAFYTATFSLGTSVSFFVIGQVDQRFGWRTAFAAAAAGSVLALCVAALVLSPRTPVRREEDGGHLLDFRPVFRNRSAMAYMLAYACHMWELFGVRSWMVAFLTFSLTLNPAQRSFWAPTSVAALTALVAMWASVAGSELALRYDRVRVLYAVMGASALFACLIGFTAALPYPMVAALCVIYAMFVQGDSAALHNGTVQNADPQRRGATMAVQSLLGFTSAFVGPLVIGIVLDATGGGHSTASWGAAFIAMGAVVALGPVVLRVLARRRNATGHIDKGGGRA